MRVLYVGTPEHSALCLKHLLDAGVNVVGVLTHPGRPFGRNLVLREPPVQAVAVKYGIQVFQPHKASNEDVIAKLSALNPDITAIFAFGEFLSDAFISFPRISTINLHLSLLPKYRGAAPVQWAIINGEESTGVTTFHLVKEMDAGDIIYQEQAPILEVDTAASLMERLTEIGSALLLRTLRDLYAGTAPRSPQDNSLATRARKLKKTDGHINWSLGAVHVHNLIRGLNPWPCAYSHWNTRNAQKMVKFLSASPADVGEGDPGKVSAVGNDLFVHTGDRPIRILSAQIEGGRAMSGQEFLNGHREILGSILV